MDRLTVSRTQAVDVSLSERRRIERDLHDGAQQQLVKLAMDLGMAREKMESAPEAAQALVVEAHEESKRALVEIRNLVRGIHPAVLTDRGLDAAVSALAGRSTIPVSVDVRLDERPLEAIESAAYFVVAEALTNVSRHSQAEEALGPHLPAWETVADRDHRQRHWWGDDRYRDWFGWSSRSCRSAGWTFDGR